jgi:O-antigen ligase
MISVAGTYGARNEMLSLIVPASLFSVYLLVTSRKKLLPLVVLIIQVVAIVISRGRLGLLTFIVIGATLYVLLNRVSFKSLSKILAFSVAVAVSAFFMMPDAYEQIIFRYTDSIIAEIDDSRGSAFIRGVITRGVLDVWLENPFFGIGPGAFLHESYNYIGLSELGPVQPHSTYLGLLAEVGVFGFLCFVIFVTVVVRVHRKAWLIGRDHRQLMIVVALATSSELILLIGFDGFLRYPLWMLIGLSLSYQYKRRADSIPQYNSAMTKV